MGFWGVQALKLKIVVSIFKINTNFSHQKTTCFYCNAFRYHGYQVCFIDHFHIKRYFNQARERCHLCNHHHNNNVCENHFKSMLIATGLHSNVAEVKVWMRYRIVLSPVCDCEIRTLMTSRYGCGEWWNERKCIGIRFGIFQVKE